jgi:hypothetical protein
VMVVGGCRRVFVSEWVCGYGCVGVCGWCVCGVVFCVGVWGGGLGVGWWWWWWWVRHLPVCVQCEKKFGGVLEFLIKMFFPSDLYY